jgi:hypothetical protein
MNVTWLSKLTHGATPGHEEDDAGMSTVAVVMRRLSPGFRSVFGFSLD